MKRDCVMRNKKDYIAPVVEEFVYITNNMLAGSYGEGNGVIIGGDNDPVDSDIDQLSAGRRGSWGNLWK